MSFLWLADTNSQWSVLALRDQLTNLADPVNRTSGWTNADKRSPVLMRDGDHHNPRWIVLAPPGADVTVNGSAVLGIRLLAHRDELRVEGRQPMYFSAEKLARVEPFTGPPGACCARCTVEIKAQSPAVCCPRCGIYHHAEADRPCWDYAPHCGACGEQSTQLDADFQWVPE